MLDGDIHILHYRKNHFDDPALQKEVLEAFPARAGGAGDLAGIPGQTAQFLHRGAEQPGHLRHLDGGQSAELRLGLLDGYRRVSGGVHYFDEGMNPTIHIRATPPRRWISIRRSSSSGRRGPRAMDIGTTIQRWQSGFRRHVGLVDRLGRVHRAAAGARVGRGPARRYRARLARTTMARSPTGRSRSGAAPPRSRRTCRRT